MTLNIISGAVNISSGPAHHRNGNAGHYPNHNLMASNGGAIGVSTGAIGGVGSNLYTGHWKLTRVFNENDEALEGDFIGVYQDVFLEMLESDADHSFLSEDIDNRNAATDIEFHVNKPFMFLIKMVFVLIKIKVGDMRKGMNIDGFALNAIL